MASEHVLAFDKHLAWSSKHSDKFSIRRTFTTNQVGSLPAAMGNAEDEFTRFEYEGWERVADKYDPVWSSLTRQLIPYLVNAAEVSPGMSVLDVAAGLPINLTTGA